MLALTEGKPSRAFRAGIRWSDEARLDGAPALPADEREAAAALLARALENIARLPSAPAPGPHSGARFSIEPVSGGPLVSVVVPMFNERRFVAETIESLKRQTLENFEAIIIDDASTDDSMAVAKAAVADDPRFRLVRHASNAGLSAARNTGLRLARAPLITFLDSDDMLFPDALEIRRDRLIEAQSQDSGRASAIGGAFCGMISSSEGMTLDAVIAKTMRNVPPRPDVDFVNSAGECPFNVHAPLVFTDLVKRCGGFDETLRFGCEDWDLWQRILRNGFRFVPVGSIAAIYRRKRGSMVKAAPTEHLKAGRLLFDRARAPIDPSDIMADAPFVFEKGLHYYEDQAAFLQRIAQYAAIGAFASTEGMLEALKMVPKGADAFVSEAELKRQVAAGVARTISVNNDDLDAFFQPDSSAAIDGVLDALFERMRSDTEKSAASARSVDVILLPQTQAQVRAMAPVARALAAAGKTFLLVTTETETGDQGQRRAMEAEGLPGLTFNRACLQELRARVFVIMRPYLSVIRDAIAEGAAIVEIVPPEIRPVSAPDENEPRVDVERIDAAQAADRIAQILDAAQPAPIEENARGADGFASAPIVIAKEEPFDQAPDFAGLLALRDKWRGERCVIIGNGPSINRTDLTKLRSENTFAVNGIFYKSEAMGFDPTFFVVEDSSVMKENVEAIKNYKAQYKLFPTLYRTLHPKEENVFFFLMNRGFYEKESPAYCIPRFSTDAARRLYCGQSVTHINLQLAYYFGFSEVYLIGVDFSYVIPDTAIRKGDLILSTEDDPNHFHGDYFGKGKTWKDPKLHRVKLNYELARDMFEADGRKVYNATKGGALEVFERRDYDEIFS